MKKLKDIRKVISSRQEKRVASDVGGRVIRGSGASYYSKGDVENRDWLIECKTTQKESISIKKKWLNKIVMEAIGKGKKPLLVIEIGGEGLGGRDWVLMRMNDFKELIGNSDE